jgi:hypothetical protein
MGEVKRPYMIRLIILIVIIILVLSFFGVSLQNLFNSPATQANFGFVGGLLVSGWHVIVQTYQNILNALSFRASNIEHAYEQ